MAKQSHIKIITSDEETTEHIYNALETFLLSLNPDWDVDMHFATDHLDRTVVKVINTKKDEE